MDEAAFYAAPGPMTDVGPHATALPELREVDDVCRVVQGLIVHVAWAELYGVDVGEERKAELQVRSARSILDRALELDPSPLAEARPPERRFVGNCRHFSVLACALLRARGIPARARCGFGGYFEPGKWIDHWVIEHLEGGRWVRTDAQVDPFQRSALDLDWDPLRFPEGAFLSGGEAWERCRTGRADPDRFGILDMWGLWFVRSNVVRDLAALNKMELLPWDGWGMIEAPDDELADRVAAVRDFEGIRALFEDERLRVPETITSFTDDGPVEVALS